MDARVTQNVESRAKNSTNDRVISHIPTPMRLGFQLASRISPQFGAEVARQLFFRPPRAPYREEQRAALALSQTALLPARERHVQAYYWGEGPAVLLLHGWGGHAGQMTEFVRPLTRAGYRVVAVDAPAHGRSGGRLSSIIHFANALEAAAGLFGPVYAIIAHSLGAAAASHAMMKGLSVRRAVFVAPQARLTGYWQLFRGTLGMSDDAWRLLRARSERWLKVRYDRLHPIDSAPHMTTPLLVLHGEADRLVPFAEGELLARTWPGAEFCALGGGHLAVLRDWRAVIAATAFVVA
jgi:pimeloyl-ACP methyl ester carboxylesterase